MPQKILVSSCLAGKKCAYDGESRYSPAVAEFLAGCEYVDVCPEMAGGLPAPRETHEITGGTGDDVLDGKARVISVSGVDRTDVFLRGAEEALKLAKANGVTIAVLKARSPACGKCRIYDGTFTRTLMDGHGVTCALLLRNNIKVHTEAELGDVPVGDTLQS